MQRLFVYGTLAPGRPNHHVLESIAGSWEKASLKGTLLQEGWGAEMGCPGIVVGDEGGEVEGFLFCSDQLAEYWPTLDQFEGGGYSRVSVTVKLQDNREVEAYVYALSNG